MLNANEAPAELAMDLYAYVCGRCDAAHVRQTAKRLGWEVWLRNWCGNEVEAVSPNGLVVWIAA